MAQGVCLQLPLGLELESCGRRELACLLKGLAAIKGDP